MEGNLVKTTTTAKEDTVESLRKECGYFTLKTLPEAEETF